MSATLLGCGHTAHLDLMVCEVAVTAPQVHLHFLTDGSEYEQLGYAKLELCCHGCGASTLVYYTDTGPIRRRMQLRNEFIKAHRRCPNRNYQSECPDWRTSFSTIDIRKRLLTVAQAALRLGVSRSSVYRLCSTGVLPHRRVSGTIRLEAQAIKTVAEARRS
jgi:excisionase family DNA binding protein